MKHQLNIEIDESIFRKYLSTLPHQKIEALFQEYTDKWRDRYVQVDDNALTLDLDNVFYGGRKLSEVIKEPYYRKQYEQDKHPVLLIQVSHNVLSGGPLTKLREFWKAEQDNIKEREREERERRKVREETKKQRAIEKARKLLRDAGEAV